jgi:hypothetical protein
MEAREVPVEIVSGRGAYYSRVSTSLGWFGRFAAGLTILAAGFVVFALLFGKVLLISAAATILWPLLFSPEFTLWVFGTAQVPFWKMLFMVALTGIAFRWFRSARTWL